MTMPTNLGGGWRIDKHIPIALIFAIAIQTASGIWWASSISNRVTENERRLLALASADRRIAVLESQIGNIDRTLQAINSKLDRVIEGRTP